MVIGAVLGLILNLTKLNAVPWVDTFVVNGLFYVIGQLFILSLKMLVVPLVFVSLFCVSVRVFFHSIFFCIEVYISTL